MWDWSWVEGRIDGFIGRAAGGGAWIWGTGGSSGRWHAGVALGVTAMAGIALAATIVISSRRGIKSPWSRRKRQHPLTRPQWNNFFSPDGKLQGGVKFLKKVRSGGIDHSIRAEVWPFLLGVYDLNSSSDERNAIRVQKRKEYEKLRRHCRRLAKLNQDDNKELKKVGEEGYSDSPSFAEGSDSISSEEVYTTKESPSIEQGSSTDGILEQAISDEKFTSTLTTVEEDKKNDISHFDASDKGIDSSDGESSLEEPESMLVSSPAKPYRENDPNFSRTASVKGDSKRHEIDENFFTWQRIIRLDAIRANGDWIPYSPSQAAISEAKAFQAAAAVGLTDYADLEPCRIYLAARLVSVLEAYALYDPEIGYCQGMSDLLTPILTVIEEDHEAFWCFVGFMKKARHNFRLDEIGIRRQLNIVSKIIKFKDSHLYRHLEKLQAEDCFFVYRMVLVIFRRELTFEQTLCLWEVMWADQAAIREGYGKSAWRRIRLRAPPTEDLLLYAIAASVLQRRKLIIERYSSMDEILRECNGMAGQLDVWKLLDEAHELVVTLHDKIE